MADITPARKLFDLLVSKDFDPEMLDVTGKPAPDPAEAEIFSFDFRAQSGKDYGTVVIMLGDDGNLDVYCADNVGKTMEGPDKTEWFDFLEQLKNFAVRNNRMNFGVKNLNHLRYSMQGQAAIKEGLFESWAGKKDISWNAGPNESRLMIKHKRNLGEGEARFRYVESLFIETAEGERYKLPFKNLTAGRAMLEHVRNGGRPYDMRGQHIAEMVTELTLLSRFRRANHGRLLEGDTAQLVEQTNAYYENLQRNLKSLTNRKGYSTYFEAWTPLEMSDESMVIEGLKHLFVTQSIDQRIEDALPLIAKIQQQENAMKEANIFESWVNTLMEGTWQLPDTPEKQSKLVELLSQDLPVGADATNVTEQLYDLIGDDQLFDQLEALAKKDANADARQVILDRLQEMSDFPEVRQVLDKVNTDADATMNPPEATNPADLEQQPVQEGQMKQFMWDLAEKLSLEQFLEYFPEDEAFWRSINDEETDDQEKTDESFGGDASDDLISDIEVPEQGESMEETIKDPRTQTEDPPNTQQPTYPEYQDDLASILKHAGVPGNKGPAPDYEDEVDEGVLGTVGGGLAGMALGGPIGGIIGAGLGQAATQGGSDLIEKDGEETDEGWKGQLAGGTVGSLAGGAAGAALGPVGAAVGSALGGTAGQMIGDKLGGKEETDESPLKGKYGHSGKLKAVAESPDFLDRLKELSGFVRN